MPDEINKQLKSQENEIDLGIFFHLLGQIVRKTSSAIKIVFVSCFQILLAILIFFKRKLLWLVLGALVGLAFGIWEYVSKGPAFYSDLTVRSNFESTGLLYSQLNYFNSLIKQDRYSELASVFEITNKEASQLIRFEVSPVNDDIEAAKLYKNTFLAYNTHPSVGGDTTWSKVMSFKEFKKQLQPYNFPLQRIRLYSSNPDVYKKVQLGISNVINNNKEFQGIKEQITAAHRDEENLLNRSLLGLDSLRQAYNVRIAGRGQGIKNEASNITLSNREEKNPEIDLYDKELIFKDELINLKRRTIEQQDILQIYSDFNPSGTKASQFDQLIFIYMIWGLLASFIILLLIELYKYLNRIERNRNLSTQLNKGAI